MITVKVEKSPVYNDVELITFTMCDHSTENRVQELLTQLLSSGTVDLNKLACSPVALPMEDTMVELVANTIEEAMTKVTDTTSIEAWIMRDGIPHTEQPGFRLLLGKAFGLKFQVWEFTPEDMDSPAKDADVNGHLEWEQIPELIGSMREELAVWRSKNPKQGPDDFVGAEA